MKNYRLIIVAGNDSEKLLSQIVKLITDFEGKVGKKLDLGKKSLSYLIKNRAEGHYWELGVELPPQNVKTLKAKFELMPELLRYLLLVN